MKVDRRIRPLSNAPYISGHIGSQGDRRSVEAATHEEGDQFKPLNTGKPPELIHNGIHANFQTIRNRVCISLIFRCVLFLMSFLPDNLFAHSRLNIFVRRVVSDNFVQNPRKGNRMLVGKQIHPNPLLTTVRKSYAKSLHILAIERCPRHMLQRKNR